MNLKKVLVGCLLATSLYSLSAQTQDLFRVSFRANCLSIGANGQISNSKLTDKDIIAQCVSANGLSSRALTRRYALVYNTTADSLQVVTAANGALVCDVIQFQAVALITDSRQTDHFAFMFVPDQINSIGTAIISQKIRAGSAANRVNITGKLQFALLGDMNLGSTNATAAAAGETATTNGLAAALEVVSALVVSGSNAITSGTNPPAVTGTNGSAISGTNVSGIVGTNVTSTPTTNALSPGTTPIFTIGTPAISVPITNAFTEVTGTTATTATNTLTGTDTNSITTNVVAVGFATNAVVTTNLLALTNLPNVRICTGTFTAGRRVP